MKTITFFSYKGGVGRTLAASNFAVYLAKLGLKVVVMDFDLDAPGVDSKFPDFSLPRGQLGLIDYILLFQRDGSDAEARIREMVALYPDPEVYRRAMRFFELTRRSEEAALFGVRLLDLVPNDEEAQMQVAKVVLNDDFRIQEGPGKRSHQRLRRAIDVRRLVSIAEAVHERGQLSIQERIRLADILEDIESWPKSFEVAMECLKSEEIANAEARVQATGIAARTAMRLGKKDEATKLITSIPASRIGGSLASIAIQLKLDNGDKEGAFQLAKVILARDLVPPVMSTFLRLAHELHHEGEVQEVMRMNPQFEMRLSHDPEFRWELERLGFDLDEFQERSPRRRSRP